MGLDFPNDGNIEELETYEELLQAIFPCSNASSEALKVSFSNLLAAIQSPKLPVGTVCMFPSVALPDNWVACLGGEILRSTILGLKIVSWGSPWGGGNGSTTVDLPDWGLRSPLGALSTGWGVGDIAGTKTLPVPLVQHSHLSKLHYVGTRVDNDGAFSTTYCLDSSAAPGEVATDERGQPSPTIDPLHPVFGIAYMMYADEVLTVS